MKMLYTRGEGDTVGHMEAICKDLSPLSPALAKLSSSSMHHFLVNLKVFSFSLV